MTLTRLSLTDFRNHAAAELVAGPGLVALHGDNGAGKTNILEAISLLAPGRGLRRAALSEMHANFLLNAGGATAADLESLGESVRKKVFQNSGITLEWEIMRVGEPAAQEG